MWHVNVNTISMKSSIFPKQKMWKEWHCFTFLQISLMSASTENSWIFVTFTVYCDVPSLVVSGKLPLYLLKLS